jgi:hypothetical protein
MGTAAEIAAKQNRTMAGQFDNVKGSVIEVGTALGNVMIPTLKRLTDRTIPVVNKITEWLEAHPKLTEALVVGGAAVASLNLALAASGSALNGLRLGLLTAQAGLIKFQGVATVSMGATAASVGLATAGVAGLASIGYQLYSNWGPIMQWWDEQWDKAFDSVADMVNQVTPLMRGLGFDVGNMRKGVFKTFDRGNQYGAMAEKLAKFQGYGAAEDPNAEPSWLQKDPTNRRFKALPGLGSGGGQGWPSSPGLLGAAARLEKVSGGKGDTITYAPQFAPQITVHPGSPQGTREAVGASVHEMRQMWEQFNREHTDALKRRSFGH